MTIEFLTRRLETGFFVSRRDDFNRAVSLLEGRLELGGRVLDVMDPNAFDDVDSLPRGLVLELHTLRWLDVLRRQREAVAGAGEAWAQVFEAWSRSETAANGELAAWAEGPAEQRSVAIALAGRAGGVPDSMIAKHLERLEQADLDAGSAARRRRILHVRLALLALQRHPTAVLRQTAVEAATSVFGDNGYAVAEDLAELTTVKQEWELDLLEIGVPPDHDVMARLSAVDIWIHAMTPAGELVPVGGARPDVLPGADDPRMRYVLTGGAEGTPPGVVQHVDPRGLISLRSGWGETERDLSDETHVTLIVGPVRGRDGHRDLSRITYHSQGRPWLVDPLPPEALGDDAHSIVAVPDALYRRRGNAELVRQYSDGVVEGFVVRNSMYAAVGWQRHVVFARTGNYVVVDDTVQSSSASEAHLQWIVAPDLAISPVVHGFFLSDGPRTVFLGISSREIRQYTIDEVLDVRGARIAWRIRVPMAAAGSRAVTVISDVVDRQRFQARRVASRDKEFTVDISDKHIDETLVVTPERSIVVEAGLEPEAAVERAIAYAATGALSPEEALAQRISVRRAIQDTKLRVRALGGGLEARLQGIEELEAVGRELKVTGLRDHAFAAALIDLAGTDLVEHIADMPGIRNARRGPLVQWSEAALVQPSYSVPVRTTVDAAEFPAGAQEPFIWSVDLGQLVVSSYLADLPGDVLTVYFHGATDRYRFRMPRYERLRSLSTLETGPLMLFSDPCLDLDARMKLSWYVGTEDVDLHREIARMIDAYARRRGIEKVMLIGNSGGGFTALQIAAAVDGARVVAFNPQIQVERYIPRISEVAHWALFGRESVAGDPRQAPRMDLIERYRRIGFDQDITYIQNPGDDLHYVEHFQPFEAAFRASSNRDRLTTLTPYLGPGHRVPPPDEYVAYVRAAIDGVSNDWAFKGLRAAAAVDRDQRDDGGARAPSAPEVNVSGSER